MTRPATLVAFAIDDGGAANAACSLPASSANLGSVTSFVLNNQASTTTGEVHVNCGAGSIASMLSSN
ncbi:MAG: hypothetical protein ACR5LG_01565 [Sodalis sp. (in: enterobacteria)]|uniref:hypothetical protein n=1 Tax=Sodalis sp. (in: enterobacteria) TaxID=1898979 RepID=UPI003F2A4ED1